MKKENNINAKEIRTIGDLLTDYIQKHIDEHYKKDVCKPTFVISQMNNHSDTNWIVLTLTHSGWSQSDVIGYETDIEKLVEVLYNRTM